MSDHGTSGHDAGEDHGIHLPDPSIWPLVVGLAAFIAGAALIWWSRDRGNDFAGPLLGIALTAVLISAAGWAVEDGRMRKKAEQGHAPDTAPGRFTQVLTFAVAEGELDAARTTGVVRALETVNLRDYEGFRDLRVIVSPAETGPSQVLVETTWKGREGLESYEGTRQTLLDLLAAHDVQVVPGTVQVFDMEIVRDTKDVAFKFGMGAAATMLTSLLIGGFSVGAGLSLFQNDTASGGTATDGTPLPANVVRATDNKFAKASLEAPPDTQVSFVFENKGRTKHNLAFLDKDGGQALAPGATGKLIDGGESETLTFQTPGPGTYFFHCEAHPDQMKGAFEVKAGVPVPGAAAAPPAGGTPAVTPTASK